MSHSSVKPTKLATGRTAFLFDLDGTLVDSVYQHVLAWREAIASVGIDLAVWTIHRRIGMSGGLMANALLRETGHVVTPEEAARLQEVHAETYARMADQVRPFPGAHDLLAHLTEAGVPFAIATSGKLESARHVLAKLRIDSQVPIVTRDQVAHADNKHGNCKHCRDPEAAPHVSQLWVLHLFKRDHARLKRHSADGTRPRRVANDFRVHRTGVFNLVSCLKRCRGLQSHSAFRTRAESPLHHPGMHRAGIAGFVRSGSGSDRVAVV